MLIYRSRRETGENKKKIRVWRSLVSRLNGVQEASSSNLDTRTKTEDRKIFGLFLCDYFANINQCRKTENPFADYFCEGVIILGLCFFYGLKAIQFFLQSGK